MKPCSVWQREATLAFELRSCCLQNSLRAANDVVRVGVIDLQERWYLSQPIPVVGHTNKEGQRMWERERERARGRGWEEGEGEEEEEKDPLAVVFHVNSIRCPVSSIQAMYNVTRDVQWRTTANIAKCKAQCAPPIPPLPLHPAILECMDHFPLCWSCSTAVISQAVEHTVFVHGSQNKARNDNIPYASGVCICSIPMFWTRPHTKRK
jgi:hypothetical protein